MSGVSMDFCAGIARLISVAIVLNCIFVSPPNESEGTSGFASSKRKIISPIDWIRQSSELVLGIGINSGRNSKVYEIRVLWVDGMYYFMHR